MANTPIREIATLKNILLYLQLPIFLLLTTARMYSSNSWRNLTTTATCNIKTIVQGASYVCSLCLSTGAKLMCEMYTNEAKVDFLNI